MSRLRGNAALHCVVTTFTGAAGKGRAPDIRYYLAVYTEDLDHFNEVLLTRQQWMELLTLKLPLVHFNQTGDCINAANQTELPMASSADASLGSRYVRATDTRFRSEYEETRVVDRGAG